MSTASESKPVPAIVRVGGIMDALSTNPRPRSAQELARELGLPRSSVHGLCHTLAELGVLVRVGGAEFTIGVGVLAWSAAFQNQNVITRTFATLAEDMPQPEALNLSILSGREVLYIGHREGSDPLAVRFREGLRFEAIHTATGKAMLSTLPDDEVTALMAGPWPDPRAPNSLRTLPDLLADLAGTRRRGFSIDNEELGESLVSCGAPVFGAESGSRAVAGVSIAMIAGREPDAVQRAGEAMVAFATEFSRRLGAMRD